MPISTLTTEKAEPFVGHEKSPSARFEGADRRVDSGYKSTFKRPSGAECWGCHFSAPGGSVGAINRLGV